jgi:hypothetical protein
MPIWILRLGQAETTPAPSHEPKIDAAMSATSEGISTWMMVM